jgi:hypothetical protein
MVHVFFFLKPMLGVKIRDEGMKPLCEYIASNPPLEVLCFYSIYIFFFSFCYFVDLLLLVRIFAFFFSFLRNTGSGLTDEGMRCLSTALEKNTTLSRLSISGKLYPNIILDDN